MECCVSIVTKFCNCMPQTVEHRFSKRCRSIDRKIMEKEKQKKMSQIENEAHLAKVTAQADADFY